MIKIEFSKEAIEALDYERFHHSHPRVRRKMEAVYLKSQGVAHQEIARLTRISENTLRRYLREYLAGGIERLKELHFYRPQSELEAHREPIAAYFRAHPPATIKEAAAKIEDLTGIKRSPTQVRAFLNSLGMRCRKVGVVPAKADVEQQEAFKNEELAPRLREAKAGNRVVFFGDASHFIFKAYLRFLWCFERLFVRAPEGRNRFSVLAALNALTHELITVTTETYINAETVCELLRQIAALDLSVPITLILDNARYQKCHLVMDLAASLHIELLYLPPYSPNLNLIERFWKFMKKECLYAKYYADFSAFKHALETCLQEAHTKHRKKLDSLLSPRFQTFAKEHIWAA